MKVSIKSGIAVVVITGMMGLSGVMLNPTVGQVISQVSTQDKLAEAERLTQQVIQLYQQGKYNEAIPLAEQALAIRKQQLGDNHPLTVAILNSLPSPFSTVWLCFTQFKEDTVKPNPS